MSKEVSAVKKRMMRIPDIGIALEVSRSKAYDLVASGEIPSVDIAGCRRVPVEVFDAYVERKKSEAAKSA